MARKFLTAIDLGTNELQNAVVQNLAVASEPTGVKGRIYFDSTNNVIKVYNGTAWKALATGGDAASTVTLSGIVAGTGNVSGGTISITTSFDTGVDTDNLTEGTTNLYYTNTRAYAAVGALLENGTWTGSGVTYSFSDIDNSLSFSIDADLVAIGELTGTSGFLKKTNTNTWTLDTNTYLTTSDASSTYAPLNSPVFTGNPTVPTGVIFEGATADAYETTLTVTDPTADNTITLPNASGTVALLGTIALGTDTTGNYVSGISAGTGIGVSHTPGEGSTATISNTGVLSITGTANEITVAGTGSDPYTGAITIGLPDNVTIGGSLTVTGDLTVNGDVTTLNTATMNIEDNIFVLNSNVTGTPAANAGLEVERGSYTNASIFWNETANKWYVGTPADNTDAAVETALSLAGHTHSTGDITGIQEYVEDTVGAMTSGSNSLSVTYTDNGGSAGTLALDTTLATTSYLSKSSGLAVDVSTLETKLVTDGFTKKYAAQNTAITVSGGVATWTVTHNLGSRDVTVQVYEVSGYGAVEVDVVRTSTSVVTLSWNSASNVSADTYRVVVTG